MSLVIIYFLRVIGESVLLFLNVIEDMEIHN